jgi:hypothetical protein
VCVCVCGCVCVCVCVCVWCVCGGGPGVSLVASSSSLAALAKLASRSGSGAARDPVPEGRPSQALGPGSARRKDVRRKDVRDEAMCHVLVLEMWSWPAQAPGSARGTAPGHLSTTPRNSFL